jgi:hypothetical protein
VARRAGVPSQLSASHAAVEGLLHASADAAGTTHAMCERARTQSSQTPLLASVPPPSRLGVPSAGVAIFRASCFYNACISYVQFLELVDIVHG